MTYWAWHIIQQTCSNDITVYLTYYTSYFLHPPLHAQSCHNYINIWQSIPHIISTYIDACIILSGLFVPCAQQLAFKWTWSNINGCRYTDNYSTFHKWEVMWSHREYYSLSYSLSLGFSKSLSMQIWLLGYEYMWINIHILKGVKNQVVCDLTPVRRNPQPFIYIMRLYRILNICVKLKYVTSIHLESNIWKHY